MKSDAQVRSAPASISASMGSSTKKVSGTFCGDAELFLDQMLEQCKKRPKARMPGFGRELVPYFTEEESMEELNGFSNFERNGPSPNKCFGKAGGSGKSRSPRSPLSPRYSNGRSNRDGRGGASHDGSWNGPRGKRRPAGGSGARGYGRQQQQQQQQQQQCEGSFFSRKASNKAASAASVTGAFSYPGHGGVEAHTCRQEERRIGNASSLRALFAGPGCFQSPPPEALPMPPAVLLAKAICPFPF
ncbi:hypothetical protein BSKO_01367 [Bryopsis sp. KO-2023]|nr:hypothetical protein BSKO_01367 [Bryopsis sp. KO-2023]